MLSDANLLVPLIAGIPLGYFLQDKKRINFSEVTFWAIMILIFSLRFSIGSNNESLNSMSMVGLNTVTIAFIAMLLSAFFVKVAGKMVKVE